MSEVDNREILLRCDCGHHVAGIYFYLHSERDEAPAGQESLVISFGTLYEDTYVFSRWILLDRLKTCWKILTGKRAFGNEIILRQKEATRVVEFLNAAMDNRPPAFDEPSIHAELVDIISGNGKYAKTLPHERIDLAREQLSLSTIYRAGESDV